MSVVTRDEPPTGRAVTVQSRPVRSARIATVVAAVVFVVFMVIALLLPHTTAGVRFTGADQFGMAGVGVLLSIGILSFTRPRMRADERGVDTRGFLGGYRHVDWDLIRAVEFPPKVRFGRLVLPGEELIPLYAVQRGDTERSVEVMDRLRVLHAEHPAAP